MKITLFAAAAVAALGLAACQPAAEDEATSATDTATDTSAMAPADGAMAPADGSMTTPPAGSMNGSTTANPGTMNPDGTMSNGAANPASPPPVTNPDGMGSTTPPPQ